MRAPRALAQVKMRTGKVSRPEVQRLVGAAGRSSDNDLFFFSFGGFTADALAYAEHSEIAAFKFHLDGDVEAQTKAARKALAAAVEKRKPTPAPVASAPPVANEPAIDGELVDGSEPQVRQGRARPLGPPALSWRNEMERKHAAQRAREDARTQAADTATREKAARRAKTAGLRKQQPKQEPSAVFHYILAGLFLGLAAWGGYAILEDVNKGSLGALHVISLLFLLFLAGMGAVGIEIGNKARREWKGKEGKRDKLERFD